MMVRRLLPGASIRQSDAADALAVAICHAHHRSSRLAWSRQLTQRTASRTGWLAQPRPERSTSYPSASASNSRARMPNVRILAMRSALAVSKVIAFEKPTPVTAMQVCPALSP